MVAASKNWLGIGLYTPAEAALYARVSPRLLVRWLYGSRVGDPVLRPELAGEPERLVTFLDFVQALAVRAVRVQHRVPLRKIRQAIDTAENHYDVTYPFAREHVTYLFGSDLIIKLGDDRYVQVSGKGARNRLIAKVAEFYMKDLTFNREGLAERYRAFVWARYEVAMDPRVRFGEPIVTSCGYSAQALWDAHKSEGSVEAAAKVYGVKPGEVEAACRYFDHVLGNAGV